MYSVFLYFSPQIWIAIHFKRPEVANENTGDDRRWVCLKKKKKAFVRLKSYFKRLGNKMDIQLHHFQMHDRKDLVKTAYKSWFLAQGIIGEGGFLTLSLALSFFLKTSQYMTDMHGLLL